MPFYEYECKSCGHIFEKLESINSEERVIDCPSCNAKAERKISLTSYHLKGSGFYNTDNKKSSAPAPSPCANGGCASAAQNGGSCPMSNG